MNTITWTTEDSAAAITEGWEIFECDGSDNGPFQICKLDAPEAWAGVCGVDTVPPALEDDTDAWVLVRDTESALHTKALAFLAQENPKEYEAIQRWGR